MHRIFGMRLDRIYPAWVAKVEKNGRSRDDLDAAVLWLTGHDAAGLASVLEEGVMLGQFLAGAPRMTLVRDQVTGVICGVRIEEIEDPLMRDLRVLD